MEGRAPQPKAVGYIRVSNEERNQRGYSAKDRRERVIDRRTKIEDAVLEEVVTPQRARGRVRQIGEEVSAIEARMQALKGSQSEVDEFERRAEEILSWSRSEAADNLDRLSPPQRRQLYLSMDVSTTVDSEGEIAVRWPLGSIPPREDGRKDGTRMGILPLHVLNPRR